MNYNTLRNIEALAHEARTKLRFERQQEIKISPYLVQRFNSKVRESTTGLTPSQKGQITRALNSKDWGKIATVLDHTADQIFERRND